MKKCPWCGKNVPTEDRICPSCGYDFSRGEMSSFYDQRQQKQAKSKIRHKNEMVIVATLAIIAGGSYIFNNQQEQTEARQNIQQTTKTISESSTADSSVASSSSSESAAKSSSAKAKKASSESKQTAKTSSKKAESKKNVAKSSQSKKSSTEVAKKKPAVKKQVTKKSNGDQLKSNMQPTEFAAAVAKYAAQKNVSKWKDVVNNSNNGILIKETTEPDIVNYLSAKGNGTVYVAFNSKDSNNEVVYSAYTINQDGSVNIYEFGTPDAPHTGNIYNPVETVSQQDLVKYLNSHKQAKNVQQMAKKVGIAHE
ncbi:zinc ribbon domain-containing protein [Limosilactobacillus portuensis]|uniref:zinc ribbon domain-containing protein n=1 Tax=Limosilactobacillus portuensis TaxID=2742601 RepID=UPI002359D468|nr:zinc ribbon domain-containing protein [Limosilactobacillus portuensis]WCT60573.1 zinc ribbon domain-containing protein [Limosilactobacillus portuensis]